MLNISVKKAVLIFWVSALIFKISLMPASASDLSSHADSIMDSIRNHPVESQVDILLDLSRSFQFSNPALSMKLVKNAEKLAYETSNPLLISNTLNAQAIMNFYLGNNTNAIRSIRKSISYVEQYRAEIPDSLYPVKRLIAMYGNAGNIYQAMGEMDSALRMLLKAEKLSELSLAANPANPAAVSSHINVLNNTAVVYQSLKKTQEADELLQEALKFGRNLDSPRALLPTLNNIGLIRIDQEKYVEATGIYREALELARQAHDSMGISGIYNNLGLINEKLGNTRKALSYYLASLRITRRLGFSIGIANTCANTGRLYSQLNMPDSAVFFARAGINEAARSGNDTYLMKNYETLASIYEKSGDFEVALQMEKKFVSVKDSIFNAEKNRQIEEMTARFETEKKEKENQILRKNIEIQQRTKLLLIISLVAFVLIALLLYYFYRLKNKSFRQQTELQKLETLRLEDQLFAEQQINKLQNEKLEQKNRELSTHILHSINKNDAMNSIILEVDNMKNSGVDDPVNCYEKIRQIAGDNLSLDKDWEQFKRHFEEVNPGFFYNLHDQWPNLTQNEQKLCAYYRINLGTKEIARMLNITTSAVQKSRYRLRKKMNIPSKVEMAAFMRDI